MKTPGFTANHSIYKSAKAYPTGPFTLALSNELSASIAGLSLRRAESPTPPTPTPTPYHKCSEWQIPCWSGDRSVMECCNLDETCESDWFSAKCKKAEGDDNGKTSEVVIIGPGDGSPW